MYINIFVCSVINSLLNFEYIFQELIYLAIFSGILDNYYFPVENATRPNF